MAVTHLLKERPRFRRSPHDAPIGPLRPVRISNISARIGIGASPGYQRLREDALSDGTPAPGVPRGWHLRIGRPHVDHPGHGEQGNDEMALITINGVSLDPQAQAVGLQAAGLEAATAADSDYVLIQTQAPLTPVQKQELAGLGVEIQEYVP